MSDPVAASAVSAPRQASGLSLEVALAVLLVVILAPAAGFRWFGFGRDYIFYSEFYDRLGIAPMLTQERFEPGFTLGAWLFKHGLGLPYGAYATVLVAGALSAKFAVFFRYCNQPLLACLIYCAAFYPLHEYTQIRIAVALAFGMVGAMAAVTGRPILGGALILAGATFQSSAIVIGVGVAIALAARIRLPVTLLICGMLVLLVQAFVPDDPVAFLSAFNPLVQDYINQIDAEVPNIFSVPNLTTMIIVIAMMPFVLLARERIAAMAFVMSLLSVAAFLALRDIPAFAHRFREIFVVFSIILVFAGRTTVIRQGLQILLVGSSLWLLRQYIVDGVV